MMQDGTESSSLLHSHDTMLDVSGGNDGKKSYGTAKEDENSSIVQPWRTKCLFISAISIILALIAATIIYSIATNDGKRGVPQIDTEESGLTSTPNIIFILMDDMGFSDFSARGSEFTTPNLDSLYKKSIDIDKHYIGLVCSPSRSQMMTGRYAWNMGLSGMTAFSNFEINSMPRGMPTVGDLLGEYSDYKSYYTGKWHLGYATSDHCPLERGFEYFHGFYTSNIKYSDKTIEFPDGSQYIDWRDGDDVDYDTQYEYSTYVTGDKLLGVINTHLNNDDTKDLPFYVQVPFQGMHASLESVSSDNDDTCDIITKAYEISHTSRDGLMSINKLYDNLDAFKRDKAAELSSELGVGTSDGSDAETVTKVDPISGVEIHNDGQDFSNDDTESTEDYTDGDYYTNRLLLCENVMAFDQVLGDLIDNLKTTNNIWDDTIIIFTSDNGASYSFGGCNYPLRGVKESFFEGGIRTNAFLGGGYIESYLDKVAAEEAKLALEAQALEGELEELDLEELEELEAAVAEEIQVEEAEEAEVEQEQDDEDTAEGENQVDIEADVDINADLKPFPGTAGSGLSALSSNSPLAVRSNAFMHGTDWAPTILGLAGVDVSIVKEDLKNGLYTSAAKEASINEHSSDAYYTDYLVDNVFDGNDLSEWILTGKHKLNPRTDSVPLSINEIDPDTMKDGDGIPDYTSAIIFKSSITDHYYKLIYLNGKLKHNSNKAHYCTYRTVTSGRNSYLQRTQTVGDFVTTNSFLFDLTIDESESTNLLEKLDDPDSNIRVGGVTKIDRLSDYTAAVVSSIWYEGSETMKTEYIDNNPLFNDYMSCIFTQFDDANPANFDNAWSPFYTWDEYLDKFDEVCATSTNALLSVMYKNKYQDF